MKITVNGAVAATVTAIWAFSVPLTVMAKEYSFEQLWSMSQESSPALEKSRWQLKSAEIQSTKGVLHWAPNLYLNAKSFTTNDPGGVFFANLGQQSIEVSDMDPATLNNPEDTSLSQVSLGVRLPLYQGGMGMAGQRASDAAEKAQFNSLGASEKEVYSRLVRNYAQLVNNMVCRKDLEPILREVNAQIKRYEVGGRRNPVGYSGLLGLRSVRNVLLSHLEMTFVADRQMRAEIESLAGSLGSDWSVKFADPLVFLQQTIGELDEVSVKAMSQQLIARQHLDKALTHKAEAMNATWRPHLGLFAERSYYNGDRGSANSDTVGAYLRWEISGSNYGTNKQVKYAKLIEAAETERLKRREGVEKEAGWLSLLALKKNITRLEENNRMLSEQVKVSKKLFRNGAINAIQLSGIFLNRAQTRHGLKDMVDQYINVVSNLRQYTNRPLASSSKTAGEE